MRLSGVGSLVCFLMLPITLLAAQSDKIDMVLAKDKPTEKSTESVYAMCLNRIPTTLSLPQNAPETMRLLVPAGEKIIDYEKIISGRGWGASIKYHSAHCDVAVYVYDKTMPTITDVEAKRELAEFDGFESDSIYEKEVGDYVFYGKAGIVPLEKSSPRQVQMVSVAAVNNLFVKYRTICRHITDITPEANYQIADVQTSQVMKETLMLLDGCLATSGVE